MASMVQVRLTELDRRLRTRYHQCLGFPNARDVDFSELYPFFDAHMNNVGDPYVESISDIHSKDFEQEVISFFADLWRAPANDQWGYLTTGSTEGNLYALYTARQRFPNAVLYYSESSHYSVAKNAHILGLDTAGVAVQPKGHIDYDALRAAVRAHRGQPAIVVANIGTTMTESMDDVAIIKNMLQQEVPDRHYIHSDAALAGAYTPFMQPRPAFDFADGADSIAVSGHKFVGIPFPCGLVMVRRSCRQDVGEHIPYIAAPDTTISGSRSGHAALFFWYTLQKMGQAGLRSRYVTGRKLAKETLQQLNNIGWDAWSNPQALTVVLRAPSEKLVRKWQLATAHGWSHIICMPGSDPRLIRECVADIAAEAKSTATPGQMIH